MPVVKISDFEVLKVNDNYFYDDFLHKQINANAYLSIVATNNCQQNCVYCINSNTDRSLDLPLEKALINIKKLVDRYHIKECVILGGEPLLYTDIFKLIDRLHSLNFEKIVLTTNGIDLTREVSLNKYMYLELFNHGLTHLNISIHNETNFISVQTATNIYNSIKVEYPYAKIRINTNVYRNNHDTLSSLIGWIDKLLNCSDSIRISNLIYKDSFSVNTINNLAVRNIMMSDCEYNKLFDDFIEFYAKYLTCIDNQTTLGFVDYTMIPLKSAVMVNRNIDSKVSEQVCENEDKVINTFKCLVNGDISLSWNENNIITLC